MSPRPTDEHFKTFCVSLERAIEKYGDLSEETLLERQRRQVETLVDLECQFRHALINHWWGASVYRGFVSLICDQNRNILSARPYFRERQPMFTAEISKALKSRSYKTLYKFHFNYQFIVFAMNFHKWGKNTDIVRLSKEIIRLRTELVEMNLPLAISRARIFWSKTPKSQMSYMDMVQTCCEGLLSGVDKFCLPYSSVFRAVLIGRCVGDLISSYSETQLHFYPNDKRKIYKANKLMRKYNVGQQNIDFDKMAREINETSDKPHKTTGPEIASLVSAASCISADTVKTSTVDSETDTPTISRFAAPASSQPDVQVEQADLMAGLNAAIHKLSIFDQKLLRLKGIAL